MTKYIIYVCSSIELYEEEPEQGRKYVIVTTYADSAAEAKEKAKAVYKDNFKPIKATMTTEEVERQRINSEMLQGVMIAYAGAELGNWGIQCTGGETVTGAVPKKRADRIFRTKLSDGWTVLDVLENVCV